MLRIAEGSKPDIAPVTLESSKAHAHHFLLSNIKSVVNTTFFRADTRPPDEVKRRGFAGTASVIEGEIRMFDDRTVFAASTLEDCIKFVEMIDHEDNPMEYHFYKFTLNEGESFSFNSVEDKESLINALAIYAMNDMGASRSEAMDLARFAVDNHYLAVNEVQLKGPINGQGIDYLKSATYGE